MKRFWVCVGVIAFLAGSLGSALAGSSADEAKAMVEKAASYFQANGKDKAIKEFSNGKGQFVKGDLYVFAYDLKATVIAHPINAKLIGMNVLETPDVDGKFYRKEIVELANKSGSGWVDYKYKNPQSGKVEQKTTYLKKVGDTIVCCGAYK